MQMSPVFVPALQFGAAKKQDALRIYTSRLQGMIDALKAETMVVTRLEEKGPRQFKGTLEKDNQRFHFVIGGSRSSTHLLISNLDGKTEYRFDQQGSQATFKAHDRRPSHRFHINKTGELSDNQIGAVSACGQELANALKDAVAAYLNNESSSLADIKGDQNF